jgi:FkbM family methyltransferase
VRLIIDAGAYIGDTTVWYLSRFPEATVIALEPNPRSFALLERNCRDYGSRAILLQAAIWPSRARLEVYDGSEFAGTTFAGTTGSSVRLAAGTQGNSCDGVTIGDLLDRFGSAHDSMVDIFKCDIEGAEVDLFSGPDDGWIRRVRTIYVDVHNAQARRIVAEFARRNGFVMQNWRELVILYR